MSVELYRALAKVQAQLKPIKADSVNPEFGSRYMSLSSLMGQVTPLLAEHELIMIQRHREGDGHGKCLLCLETQLIHLPTGQSLSSQLAIPCPQTAHGIGSATTYARRYMAATLLGVVIDDDDDGNGSSVPQSSQEQRVAPPPVQQTVQAQRPRPAQRPAPRSPQGRMPASQPYQQERLAQQPPARNVETLPPLTGVKYETKRLEEGAFIIASGQTINHKHILKAAGFSYHVATQTWRRPA